MCTRRCCRAGAALRRSTPPSPPASRPCAPADGAALAGLTLHLSCNDAPVATGQGSAVLDGPVQALAHLVGQALAEGWRLPAGAIVTTGTLTDAQPLAPGQHWRTRIEGIELPGPPRRKGQGGPGRRRAWRRD